MGGMGADGSYGKGERGQWGSNTVAAWMTAFCHADGWAMRTVGPGYQPGQQTKEKHQNEKHQKK